MKKTQEVRVLEENTVQHNKETFAPGEHLFCDPHEANRLFDAGVVGLVFEAQQERWITTREELLVQVIGCLDPDTKNKADWTRSELPQTVALFEIMGEPVTAAERDLAYTTYLAMKNAGND